MLTSREVAAICYADIFDFPLTKNELKKFAIKNSFKKRGQNIQQKDGLFFLKGRDKLTLLRKKRASYSQEKLQIAKRITHLLCHIPTIQMIAVTGALAMENCDREDDVDLLIVSKAGTVWTTRLFSIVLLELLGKRRRPKQIQSQNKICMNMFLDENHLGIPKKEQDVFSAHEVAQVKALWSRGETEQIFWQENIWIKKFLPNYPIRKTSVKKKSHRSNNFFELMAKHLQLQYMKSKRTTEVIYDGYLRFHPNDARKWVIPEYEKRLAMIGLK